MKRSITYFDPYAAKAQGGYTFTPQGKPNGEITDPRALELFNETHVSIKDENGSTELRSVTTITRSLAFKIDEFMCDEAHIYEKFGGEKPKAYEIYQAAGFSPATWNRIVQGKLLDIERGNVLTLALALRLNPMQTEELMQAAGFVLNYGFEVDAAVMYFIQREIYDMDYIREVLGCFSDIKNGLDRFHF